MKDGDKYRRKVKEHDEDRQAGKMSVARTGKGRDGEGRRGVERL